MFELDRVSKSFGRGRRANRVLANCSIRLPPGEAVALLGRNGAGKSTLLGMLSGAIRPSAGRIVATGRVSYPIGFAGAFHPDLTGVQNTRFVARIYDVDTDELCDFVEGFADLGQRFYNPFRSYSAGMKARLGFGVSMGLRFETYLVDEITAVGDAAFRESSALMLEDRLNGAGAVVVSHSVGVLRRLCTSGMVLEKGKLHYFEQLEDAIALHETNMVA